MDHEFIPAENDFYSATHRFYVFAYGLDMDEENVKVYNPDARVNTVACLRNYKMVFKRQSSRWQGAIASIDTKDGEYVWGLVWENDDIILHSNVQEGPKLLSYVEVETIQGRRIVCRTPQIAEVCEQEDALNPEDTAHEHLPSRTYIMYMSQAARKARLPAPYITELETLETNKKVVLDWGGTSDEDKFGSSDKSRPCYGR